MKAIHLKEEMQQPRRVVLAIFELTRRQYLNGTEWVIICEGTEETIVARLKNALDHFSKKQQCTVVTRDVRILLSQYGLSLPQGWRSFKV